MLSTFNKGQVMIVTMVSIHGGIKNPINSLSSGLKLSKKSQTRIQIMPLAQANCYQPFWSLTAGEQAILPQVSPSHVMVT
jgi:hypothetical protein